jgi:hypothetical protein
MAGKPVLSMDKAARGETAWLLCCWDDCQKQGVDSHKTRLHDHNTRVRCDDIMARHVWYVFCSERHRQLFLHSHVDNGKLPVGERGRLI